MLASGGFSFVVVKLLAGSGDTEYKIRARSLDGGTRGEA
jgi:hypothetical protein